MKKAILAAALMVAANAYAAQTNNGCQGNCPTSGGGSNATATGGNGYATSVGIGMGGQGGTGGTGGQGGAGGSAVATGGTGGTGYGGAGGSVLGSGNSSNANSNSNLNNQGQHQGQSQGQGQSQAANSNQSQSSKNDNRSNAANTNSNANSGNNSAQTTRIDGDTTVSVYRAAAGTAYAGALTASNGTCMGSTTAGGQGLNFGFSVGSTWKDSGCDRRYNAQALAAVGQAKAAVALLCQDPDIKAAMETAGTPCQATKAEIRAEAAQKAEAVAIDKNEPADPIIRAHIGLPPLK